MRLWYVGYADDSFGSKVELFTVDKEEQAQPEESGYGSIDGPYYSEEDAREVLDRERL